MAGRGAGRLVRIAATVVLAALASFHVLRTAAVAERSEWPELATMLWRGHPGVITDQALIAVARVAAKGQPVPAATRADLRAIAAREPLSPEPFLVEGAIAETEGRSAAAERLLLEARDRDPRSRGARYLLAERFFRTGRVTDALIEMQALVSLQRGGGEPFLPALIAYARTPGAVPELKAFFRRYPTVEAAVLSQLALDAANAELVLALANVHKPDPDWRPTLISSLASAGEYRRAHAIWRRFGGGSPGPGLFNPAFATLPALPPFNWAFAVSSEGVAEPDGKGGLEVLYYGRANAVLVSQLLLLPPGQYRLSMTVDGASGEPGTVQWQVRCAKGGTPIADLPLRAGRVDAQFAVPAGCDAQWLELQGVAGELPRTSELTIRALGLTRGADL